jgi:hypothetical protein
MPQRSKVKFTKKELLFVEKFDGDAAKAAELAGYKQPQTMGKRVLAREHVAAAINEKIKCAVKESGKQMGRRIAFSRNDIIMGLADEAGLNKEKQGAESDSARVSALSKLADIFQLSQKSTKDTDMFAGWTDEELEQFQIHGTVPERFGGLSAAYDHEQPTGLSAGPVSPANGPQPSARSRPVRASSPPTQA